MKTKRKAVAALHRVILVIAALVMYVGAIANDATSQPVAVSVKGSVPVNYYQAFMITIAVIYGLYLVIRAKRRKRNHNPID